MPEMDGLELLKEIRADKDLQTLPVLFVSAEADHEKVMDAIKEGASNYIVKPFSNDTLERKIAEMFS